jgi:PEP-CTERM motif
VRDLHHPREVGDKVINLGGLSGFAESAAYGINDAGQAVGVTNIGNQVLAIEWSHGKVIELGLSPSLSPTFADSINDAGQVAGYGYVGDVLYAAEWSDGNVINLGPGIAYGINDAGEAVGYSNTPVTPPVPVPEPSTWAMMLVGFAGLGFWLSSSKSRPLPLLRTLTSGVAGTTP